jgi:hypothetical protein
MPHPIFTLFSASLVAAAMAMLENRTPRERLYAGVRMFCSCMATVIGGSWVMHLIHG